LVETIEADGDYLMLIIAPKLPTGTYKVIVEREFLKESITSTLEQLPEISMENITIYELKKAEID
jgi:hypothetical protein